MSGLLQPHVYMWGTEMGFGTWGPKARLGGTTAEWHTLFFNHASILYRHESSQKCYKPRTRGWIFLSGSHCKIYKQRGDVQLLQNLQNIT